MDDNAALARAMREADQVFCVFCFDTEILDKLDDKADRRVHFIHESVTELQEKLRDAGGELIVRHGRARDEIPQLAEELEAEAVYANRDYEPSCIARDADVEKKLAEARRAFMTSKDHVVFEKDEVLTKEGSVYGVYSPYKKAWRARLTDDDLATHATGAHGKLAQPPGRIRSSRWRLGDMGFEKSDLAQPGGRAEAKAAFDQFLTRIERYGQDRDFPDVDGTSRLSVHIRFGTLCPRELVREARDHGSPGAEKWIDEIIWREFYVMQLAHNPRLVDEPYQEKYAGLEWREDREQFQAWCEGRTGYPIVDAGMRQLNTTGYMHNRLRMVTASFLTKDLRIQWKWGERYFARQLLDYDMSQNIGGWQWTAGIGTDAQPYFRIFNPISQSKKFDADGDFIRRYVPELSKFEAKEIHAPWETDDERQQFCKCVIGEDYPHPLIDHSEARDATLAWFKNAAS